MSYCKVKMSEGLPHHWVLQMSIYKVKIGGENVITRVADCEVTALKGISELRSKLKSDPYPVVGIDVVNSGDLFLFYVKNRCLIIQYNRLFGLYEEKQMPSYIASFLRDKSITFVCSEYIYLWSPMKISDFKKVVSVEYLAARIHKKPKLLTSTLEELLVEVDIDIKKPVIAQGSLRRNWESSEILSEEEVKVAMYKVYSCYQIATKLTDPMNVGQ